MIKRLCAIVAALIMSFMLVPTGISFADEKGTIEFYFFLQYGMSAGNIEFSILDSSTHVKVGTYNLTPNDYVDKAYKVVLPQGRYVVYDMKMDGPSSDTYTYEVSGEDGTPGIGVYAGQTSQMEAYIGSTGLSDSVITEQMMFDQGMQRYPVQFMLNACDAIENNIIVTLNDQKEDTYELVFSGGDDTKGLVTKRLPEGDYEIVDIHVAGENDNYEFEFRGGFSVKANQETTPIVYFSCKTQFGKYYYRMTAHVVDENEKPIDAPDFYITYVIPAEEEAPVDTVLMMDGGHKVTTIEGSISKLSGPCELYVCEAFYLDSFGKGQSIEFDRLHVIIPEDNTVEYGYTECTLKLVRFADGTYEMRYDVGLYEMNDLGNYVRVTKGSYAEPEESSADDEGTREETQKAPDTGKPVDNDKADKGDKEEEKKGGSPFVIFFVLLWVVMLGGAGWYLFHGKKKDTLI